MLIELLLLEYFFIIQFKNFKITGNFFKTHNEKDVSDMFLEIQNLVGIIKYLKHIDSVFLVDVFAKSFLKKQV